MSASAADIERLDRRMMLRALREARRGRTSPNPRVGAVVAREGRVIAVGHHVRAGEDHAEVAAIKNAAGDTRGATLYCTLEPCNHFGRTPPCTDAVIAAGFARVVIGCADPKPHVPGAVEKLRARGIEVVVGVHERAARREVADFTRHITAGLPLVTLKAAVTLDGRIAARSGDSRWITGQRARAYAHRLRDRADAVLVGVGTVLADDPALTVRHVRGRDPLRVVLDTHLRTPPSAKVLAPAERKTIVVHGPHVEDAAKAALAHAELVEVPVVDRHVALEPALRELARRDVMSVLAEGGAAIHGALLRQRLAQRAAIFVAPLLLGDPAAIPLAYGRPIEAIADGWRLEAPRLRRLGVDALFEGELVHTPRDPAS